LDVVLGYQVGGDVSFVMNDGGRRLSVATSMPFENGPTIVALGDINNDGLVDIGVATAAAAGRIGVTLGRGSGQFDPFGSNTFPAHVLPSGLSLVDFDQDNQLELIVGYRGTSEVCVLPSNLAQVMTKSDSLGVDQPRALVAADLNGDGCVDVATANQGSNSVTLLFCVPATRTFTPPTSIQVGETPLAIAAGLLNRDTSVDLAITLPSGNIAVLTNNGSGSFTMLPLTRVGSQPVAIAAGDVDGDGFADLITANQGDGAGEGGSLTILLSSNPQYFQTDIRHPLAGLPRALRIADIDNDGRRDLIVPLQETGGASLNVLFNTTR
jgi:hypothetical protein